MKNYCLLAWIIFSTACTSSPQENKGAGHAAPATVSNVTPVVPSTYNINGCYLMIIERDTAHMELSQKYNVISGPLTYKPFQKDRSAGYLILQTKKDRLEGWYTFSSEGRLSVRQFVFKYENGNLEEGYGDVFMKGDSVLFRYPAALRYEDKNPFKKVACP